MKQVTIYTRTSSKQLKINQGYYAAVAEYITKEGPVFKPVAGCEENTTYNRLTLQAITEGLNLLNQPCEVTIYTDCQFIMHQINRGSPEKWKRSEWIKSSGGGVKHKDLWQQFLQAKGNHKITVVLSKYADYNPKMKEELETQLRLEGYPSGH